MASGYQTFTQKSTRTVYCSGTEFKNHDAGRAWITAALAHFNIRGDDIMNINFPVPTQPPRAVVWSPT